MNSCEIELEHYK